MRSGDGERSIDALARALGRTKTFYVRDGRGEDSGREG
jgi:predicted DNA-binding protein